MAETPSTPLATPSSGTEEVLVSVEGHVGIITLNAPDRMNTISGAMLDGISAALLACDADPKVRCIVFTGAGRAFCAGLDLAAQMAATGADGDGGGQTLGGLGDLSAMAGEIDLRNTPPIVLHQIDTPVICALNGGAAGYGLDLALGCDIRIAASSAKLNPGFAKRGILPESGGTWLLPRIVGVARAAEIALRGRTLMAGEALELGLVNEVVEADEVMKAAMSMAAEIAANAPLAIRAIKRMMRAAETETFEQHVHHVYLQLLPLLGTRDFAEGVAAYIERREPLFEGR